MAAKYVKKSNPWNLNDQDFPGAGSMGDRLAFLVRYAILAPSSHNTQPWKFSLHKNQVQLWADTTRWLRVADADQRELYISLGCALENLVIAAHHFGYATFVTYLPAPDTAARQHLAATVELQERHPSSFSRDAELFDAIPLRCTNHKAYDGRLLPSQDLQRLCDCGAGEGVIVHLTADPECKRVVDDLIVRGDILQFSNSSFREELAYWMGQGIYGTSWLLNKLEQMSLYLRSGEARAKEDSQLLSSSPVLGILGAEADDRSHHLKVGQVFERICLLATTLGISVQPISQIIEVPELRRQVADLFPTLGACPQQAFRLGYAEPEDHHTPRRPLKQVLLY